MYNKEKKEELAEALVYVDTDLLDMGDFYSDTVSYLCEKAKIDFDFEANYNEQAKKAYGILIDDNPSEIISLLDILFNPNNEYMDVLEGHLEYDKEIKPVKHPTIHAIRIIMEFVEYMVEKQFAKHELLQVIHQELKYFYAMDLEAIQTGYAIGQTYFRYLNPDYFGVVTNSYFRVGHTCTRNEKRAIKYPGDYLYCAHAEFSQIGLSHNGFAYFIKRNNSGEIVADIYSYERDNHAKVVYKNLRASIPVAMGSVDNDSMRIADTINTLAKNMVQNIK